mgnify:CR=1 FL=1
MADKQVRIVISATDNFSTILNKYNQAMGQASTETQQFNQAAGAGAGGVDNLTTAVKDAVVGFIAFKAVGMISELIHIGGAANATQATFAALSGGISEATKNLEMMRSSTGGIVADTALMAGANRLLAMRIAESGEQAAQLSAVAVNLGRAFGQDASTAIENFSLLIANQSYLRLDSLGIAAGQVRQRVKELAEEFPGMSKQAKFTQATLEAATSTVDRLGTSITAAQTPLAKLETSFENLKTKAGQAMAEILNTAITTFGQLSVVIEHGLGTTMQMSPTDQQATINSAQSFAQTWGAEFGKQVGTLGMPDDFSGTDMLQRIEETRQRLGAGAGASDMVQMAGEDMWYSQAQIDRMKQVYGFITAQAPKIEEDNNRVRASEMARFNALMSARTADQVAQASALNDTYKKYYGGGSAGAANPMQSLIDWAGGTTGPGKMETYANDKMYQFQSNTSDIGKFMDPAALDDIKARFEELQELNERGLITDDSLAKAEEFKNSAEAAANAFKNMSLTDIFGQTNGGMKGQIGDMVIAQMKKNGASDEDIAAAQQKFDLGSGRQTSASVSMQKSVAPMIAALPPADQQKAIENVNAFLEIAAKMNLTPDQIASGLPGAAGVTPGGAGQGFTIKAGQTPGEIAAALGISVEQLLAVVGAPNSRSVQPGSYSLPGTGGLNPNYNPQTYAQGIQGGYGVPATGAAGANPFVSAGLFSQGAIDAHGENAGAEDPVQKMLDMKDRSADVVSNIQDMQTQLDGVTSKAEDVNTVFDKAAAPREIKFTVKVDDQSKGLLSVLVGAGVFATINTQAGTVTNTRDNGGRVPGVDGRVGQRPGLG